MPIPSQKNKPIQEEALAGSDQQYPRSELIQQI